MKSEPQVELWEGVFLTRADVIWGCDDETLRLAQLASGPEFPNISNDHLFEESGIFRIDE